MLYPKQFVTPEAANKLQQRSTQNTKKLPLSKAEIITKMKHK